MAQITKKEEEGLREAMEMAKIKDALLIANSEDGKCIFFKHGDDDLIQRLLAGLCRRHDELLWWFLGVIRIASGAKYLNISIDEESSPPNGQGPGAEA